MKNLRCVLIVLILMILAFYFGGHSFTVATVGETEYFAEIDCTEVTLYDEISPIVLYMDGNDVVAGENFFLAFNKYLDCDFYLRVPF